MDNLELTKQLYTILEQNVFYGNRLRDRNFVTLIAPGQFISTKMKKNNSNDQWTIWNLSNKCLDTTFYHKHLPSTISGIFGEILEFGAIPQKVLSPGEIRELDRLRILIGKYQSAYQKYQEIDWHLDREITRELQKEDPDPVLVGDLRRKIQQNRSEWQSFGFKRDYEDAVATREDILRGNPATFWNEIKQNFDSFKRQAVNGSYYETYLSPHPSEWPQSGWARYTFQLRKEYAHEYAKSTSWSAGGSGRWGLWRAGGSYSKSEEWRNTESKTERLDVSLEALVVNVERPWLYRDVFARRYWTWRKTHGCLTVSDGGDLMVDPPIRPQGPLGMPFLPEQLFIVRNVRLRGDFREEDYDFYKKQVSAKASFGWGPFSVRGNYSEQEREETYQGTFANNEILIEHPQIFALFGTLTPQCPNPDYSLPFNWNEAAQCLVPPFLDTHAFEETQMIEARDREVRARLSELRSKLLEQVDDQVAREHEMLTVSASSDGVVEPERSR